MYYYRLLTIPLFTILPRPQPFASRKPTCAGSPRILLFYYFTFLLFYYFTILLFYYYSTTTPAVCISETDLRRSTQDFTILLFYFYHEPSRLHLGNRPAPVHPGFYYFFHFSISVRYYSTMYYFTVNYSTIYYSTTTPAFCISEADLLRFTQDFTILLLQYCTILLCTILLLTFPLFTILPRPQPFASRKPTCAGSPRILLFYYFSTILPRPQPFASRKPTCAGSPRILLFY